MTRVSMVPLSKDPGDYTKSISFECDQCGKELLEIYVRYPVRDYHDVEIQEHDGYYFTIEDLEMLFCSQECLGEMVKKIEPRKLNKGLKIRLIKTENFDPVITSEILHERGM